MSACTVCDAAEAGGACARCGAAICEACAQIARQADGSTRWLCPTCAKVEVAVELHDELLDAVERTEKLLSRIILILKGHALYTRSRAEEIGQLHQDLTDLIARAHGEGTS
ncbi:MAG: hypothetical protein JXA09_05590 [Anaerolineae bacterium]|nr:hypothetical protein [Anaerolineae bacterium]